MNETSPLAWPRTSDRHPARAQTRVQTKSKPTSASASHRPTAPSIRHDRGPSLPDVVTRSALPDTIGTCASLADAMGTGYDIVCQIRRSGDPNMGKECQTSRSQAGDYQVTGISD